MKHIQLFEEFMIMQLTKESAYIPDKRSPGGFSWHYAKKSPAEAEKIVTEAYSESQVERLLNMDPIKITVKPDEVTVVVEGNDLGYDDDQYYKISWYPSDKQVQSGAFKDARCTKFISGNDWSEEVKSLEDFADVVNGDADGGWE